MKLKFMSVLTYLLLLSGPVSASIPCPPMPKAVTDVNRDVRSEISGSVASLGKVKAGDIAIKTEVLAINLFGKYPNVDRLVALQTMAATYCQMLVASTLTDKEKLARWERFQGKVLNLKAEPPKPPSPQINERQSDRIDKVPGKPGETGDRVIDKVEARLAELQKESRQPSASDIAGTLALLFSRPAFYDIREENWEYFLYTLVKTRLILEQSISLFPTKPEVRNALSKATHTMVTIQNDVAELYGPTFSITEHIARNIHSRDKFTSTLRSIKAPNSSFFERRNTQIRELRQTLCSIGLVDGCQVEAVPSSIGVNATKVRRFFGSVCLVTNLGRYGNCKFDTLDDCNGVREPLSACVERPLIAFCFAAMVDEDDLEFPCFNTARACAISRDEYVEDRKAKSTSSICQQIIL